MGKAYSTCRGLEMCTIFWSESLEARDHLEDLGMVLFLTTNAARKSKTFPVHF
jgi:hypothetical protein